jgi:transposase-like protein
VAKRRVGKHPIKFRRMVIERMKQSDNIAALSDELGVNRSMMYKWRRQLDRIDRGERRLLENSPETNLRTEVDRLKRLLADKTLESDFFKGALQKVEARRQQSEGSGEKAFTTKSGK